MNLEEKVRSLSEELEKFKLKSIYSLFILNLGGFLSKNKKHSPKNDNTKKIIKLDISDEDNIFQNDAYLSLLKM